MPKLYVVATPIGNLGDLSPRMEEALREADLVAAEDTRVTMKLLSHIGVKKPMISLNRHNEREKSDALVARMLAEDLTVALTSDAGTPCISDPGAALVNAARAAGVVVTPICGPSALASALSVSGFDARSFSFYGFLPRKNGELRQKLREIRQSGERVAICYESPHRVLNLVREMCVEWPGCRLCACCDLSKLYESVLAGPCEEVLKTMEQNPNVEKGEYCVVADLSELPALKNEIEVTAEIYLIARLLDGAPLNEAAEDAERKGFARNDVYRAKLRLQKRNLYE